MDKSFERFSKQELAIIGKLNTPFKVQEFIDTLKYNESKRISSLEVIKGKKADCLEAAMFAIAVLKYHNYECFLVDLESVRDEDHELCIYKKDGLYGSIAQSKFLGLKGKYPVYKTIRELIMCYYEHYFNFFGELTLRAYSIPIRISNLKWIYSLDELEKIEKKLFTIKHYKIVDPDLKLPLVSIDKFRREILLFPKNIRVGKKYR
ncbi:MAG: hypothetical protein ABIJ34_00850 [archaeon]